MCYDTEPDFKDHDPHDTNSHIKIQFSDVLAEPSEFHSCGFIWQGTECCFHFMFSICYGLPAALCHVWVSLGWGLQFGHLLFWHVWCLGPFTQILGYVLHVPGTCLRLCVRCVLDPFCEAGSYIFFFCGTPPQLRDGDRSNDKRGSRSSDWQPLSFL
ncbi:hypothetical protein ACOMHN_041946 [Nucella lapillus]